MTPIIRLRRFFRSNRGEAPLLTIVLFFLLFILIAIVMEYMKGLLIMSSVRGSIDKAVISVATDNSYNAYNGFREGTGATINAYDKTAFFETEDVWRHLETELGLTRESGSILRKYTSEHELEYSILYLDVYAENADTDTAGDSIRFVTTAVIEVPLRFMGVTVAPQNEIEVTTYYNPKF